MLPNVKLKRKCLKKKGNYFLAEYFIYLVIKKEGRFCMSEIAGVGAQPVQAVEVKNTPKKKEVVYVSNNPDRAANAAGVVAGTAGMTGGAVLGGMVGLVKVPGKLASTVAGRDYAALVRDPFNTFKATIKSNPQVVELLESLRYAKDANNFEEIIKCVSTLSERVTQAFENDKAAKNVIDKVVDPIVKSITVKKNIRNYGSGFTSTIKSPFIQTIMMMLGFNKKPSEVIGGVTGNIATGFATAVENIKTFSPEEKQAWSRVCDQIGIELESNPAIKVSKSTIKTFKGLIKDPEWLSKPFKTMQETIINGTKRVNKDLSMAVIKSVGLHSVYGALACGGLSILGWLGLKKSIMRSEEKKLNDIQ